ncbi:MAG TPA: tetratricopeptide repeat protein [Candidatus Koribacter sp.]
MLTRSALLVALLSLALCLGCSTAQKQYSRANTLEHSGKSADALKIYEDLLPHTRSKAAKSQLYVHIGECEWTLDHQAESLNAFLKAAELDPSNTSAQLHLAQLFLAGGAPEKARIFADIVLAHDPTNLDALAVSAGADAFLGNTSAAIKTFTEILARDPGRADAAVTLSQLYDANSATDDARKVLVNAAIHSPKDVQIQLALAHFEEEQGHVPEAEAAYRKAITLRDDANTNLKLAQFLERNARIPEAEEVLRKVDSLRPAKPYALADFDIVSGKDDAASREYLDLLLHRENDAKDKTAAALAARAIEAKLSAASQQTGSARELALQQAKTELGTHRQQLGETTTKILAAEISLVQGDAASAEILARSALEDHADSPSAHYVLGVALARLGKTAEAASAWQAVTDDDPSFVPARLSLAELSLSQGNLSAAEQLVVPVVRAEPANLTALDLFAKLLIAQKDYASADSIAMRYQLIEKTSPEPHLLLGDAALAQHRLAYALIEFEQAILLDPNSTDAMDGLVRVYHLGEITKPMLQRMERTAGAAPASPTLMELAGRLYAEHNWNDDAARCFQKAIAIDPKRNSAAVQLTALESRTGRADVAASTAAETSASNSSLVSAVRADDARNRPEAIRHYEEALQKGDSTGVAANNLAWIYAEQGTNLDRALQLAERARESNPINPAVTDTLGYVLLKRREYSMALAELKHADELLRAQKSADTQLAAAIHQHLEEASRNAGEKTPE